jgi:hypothetical protein
MPFESSVHVRSIEHARSKRLAHGVHAGHDSTRIIRPSKTLPPHAECRTWKGAPGISAASPDRLLELRVTSPAQCPRLCRAAVLLLSGLARPARRPTRRRCLGHAVSQPRPAAPTPPGHPTDRRQPDSGTHLHRDHPAGLRDDARRRPGRTRPAARPLRVDRHRTRRRHNTVVMVNGLTMDSNWNTTGTGTEVASANVTGGRIWLRAAADIRPGASRPGTFSTAPTAPTSPACGPRSPWATPGSSSWAAASPLPTTPRRHSAAPSASHGSR